MTDLEIEEQLEQLRQATQELADIIRPELERLGEALRKLVAQSVESLRQFLDALTAGTYTPDPPKKKPPRPPRCAGPQNKGREWNRQPQRLARSHCRKYRR